MDRLSFSRIQNFFANWLFINFNFHGIHNYFAKSICIHNLFHKFIMNSVLFRETSINSLSINSFLLEFLIRINSLIFSRTHWEFTINLGNLLWIHEKYWEFTMNSLTSREFPMNSSSFVANGIVQSTIFFLESLWIHYPRREFAINLFCMDPLQIHYKFREFTMN